MMIDKYGLAEDGQFFFYGSPNEEIKISNATCKYSHRNVLLQFHVAGCDILSDAVSILTCFLQVLADTF